MADGDLFLVSETGDTINLNPLLSSNEGVQAVAGLTGFGLPPVELQYQVGAGDGAVFRGQRLLPRDIDLPFHITGPTRASLRTHVNRLASALAGECTLRFEDAGQFRELTVRRVGGGDYVYGTDTDGLTYLNMVVSVRAAHPHWTHATATTVTQTNMSIGPMLSITNPGSAEAYPVWTAKGPGRDLTIMGSKGNLLSNPTFETNTSGWLVGGGCTIARSTAQAHSGVASLAATCITAGAISVRGADITTIPVVARKRYYIGGWVRSGTTARQCRVQASWRGAAGVAMNTVSSAWVDTLTTGWTLVTFEVEAPQGAQYIIPYFQWNTAALNEVFYLDDASTSELTGSVLKWEGTLVNGESLTIDSGAGTVIDGGGVSRYGNLAPAPRFSPTLPGATSWVVDFPNLTATVIRTNLWTNPSFETNITGWTAMNSSSTIARSSTQKHSGTWSLAATATGSSSYPKFRSAIGTSGVPVTANTGYAFQFRALGPRNRYVRARLYWWDSAGVYIGSSELGQPITWSDTEWLHYTGTATSLAGSAYVHVEIDWSQGGADPVTAGEILYVDSFMLEAAATANPFFDGSTIDTPTETYSWTGTAHASTSTLAVSPDRTQASVACSIKPRDWMVV